MEERNIRPVPTVNPALCVGCGHCEDRCPTGAIQVTDYAHIDGKKCLRCYGCAGRCPMRAIG